MKYLWLIAPLLLSGCSSIKYVTVDHGQLITENNKHLIIVGNPPMVCHYEDSPQTWSGYFVYLKEDGTVVLDDFGRGNIELMDSPICRLEYDN
jgi:hypothetical protein